MLMIKSQWENNRMEEYNLAHQFGHMYSFLKVQNLYYTHERANVGQGPYTIPQFW